jgi:hypothetical protein
MFLAHRMTGNLNGFKFILYEATSWDKENKSEDKNANNVVLNGSSLVGPYK